jgi:hypothetical protein
MKAMTISRIGRQSAYYAAVCAFVMLAMSTSHAAKPSAFADDDNVSTSGGDGETVVHIDVLANDTDPDGLIADLIVTMPPGFDGTAVRQGPDFDVAEPGSLDVIHVDYTIAPGFGGTETFTYEIVDKNGKTLASATVTITVDGSTSITKPGAHKVVFGGAAFPGSEVPLSAAGELAKTGGTSTTQCCTVRDPRVRKGKGQTVTFEWTPFDLGAALNSSLADGCDMPKPAAGTLIVPRQFSVHTENLNSTNPDDYEFGVCVVNTDVEWDGPIQVDIVAEPVVGYAVDCKDNERVDKQPLTLGLSIDPKEFTAPQMRPVTSECDPRGVTRWSTWFFVVNAVHRTDKENSRGYVASLFSVLNSLIEEMRKTGAADTIFLRDLKSLVLQADGPSTPPASSMAFLDNATLMALTPPDNQDPYSPNGSFSNPKGELVSHLAALRYAVCSELAFPGALENCRMNDMVDAALPQLP